MRIDESESRDRLEPARPGRIPAILAALWATIALLLAGMPGEAEAAACQKARLKKGCVNGADVKFGAVRPEDLRDEAGAHFALGRDRAVNREKRPFVSLTVSRASETLRTAVVMWSANIGGSLEPDSNGTVVCTAERTGSKFEPGSPVSGSVDRNTRPLTSIGGLDHFRISVADDSKKLKFRLRCNASPGAVLSITRPSIAVILYP